MTSNMTQDEIIWQNEVLEMARQAGFGLRYEGRGQISSAPTTTEKLEAFAKLVEERIAAKERERITDEYWSCIQSDLEHGVKSLNQKATEDFYQKMPELSKFGRWLEARGEQHEQ